MSREDCTERYRNLSGASGGSAHPNDQMRANFGALITFHQRGEGGERRLRSLHPISGIFLSVHIVISRSYSFSTFAIGAALSTIPSLAFSKPMFLADQSHCVNQNHRSFDV